MPTSFSVFSLLPRLPPICMRPLLCITKSTPSPGLVLDRKYHTLTLSLCASALLKLMLWSHYVFAHSGVDTKSQIATLRSWRSRISSVTALSTLSNQIGVFRICMGQGILQHGGWNSLHNPSWEQRRSPNTPCHPFPAPFRSALGNLWIKSKLEMRHHFWCMQSCSKVIVDPCHQCCVVMMEEGAERVDVFDFSCLATHKPVLSSSILPCSHTADTNYTELQSFPFQIQSCLQ